MNKLNKEDLQNILNKHKLWLLNEEGGECANLSYANLSYANLSNSKLSNSKLSNADLSNSKLSNVDLRYTDLRYANLSNADLRYANLSNADLRYANLSNAKLSNSKLSNVDLRYANLRYANLSNADLSNSKLSNVDLRYTDLKHIKTNMHTIGYHLACPEKGSFVGYKKAFDYLITLLILKDAKRSSATTLKCRCDKAKVLEIKNIMTGELISKIESEHDENFIYKVGEIVKVEDFDDDRWNECSTGIHFFMNKENAINY